MSSKSKLAVTTGIISTILILYFFAAPSNNGLANPLYLPLVTRLHPSPFGVTMYEGILDEGALQLLKNMGCKWVTFMVHWGKIEANPPIGGVHTYDWSQYDTDFTNLKAAGLEPFVLFTSNPAWASNNPRGPVPAEHLADLVEVTRNLAERYDCDGIEDAPGSLCVNYWSFYIEPDSNRGWGHLGAQYAEMLSLVSPAIHSANPQAKVINGGIAYDNFEPVGPFVQNFLSDTLSALNGYPGGAAAYLDGIAFNYYKLTFPSVRDKAEAIRAILQTHQPAPCR